MSMPITASSSDSSFDGIIFLLLRWAPFPFCAVYVTSWYRSATRAVCIVFRVGFVEAAMDVA